MGIEEILKPLEEKEERQNKRFYGRSITVGSANLNLQKSNQTEAWKGIIELNAPMLFGKDGQLILEGVLNLPAGYTEDMNKLQLLLEKKSCQYDIHFHHSFPFCFHSIKTARQREFSTPFMLNVSDLDEIEGEFKVYKLPIRRTIIRKRVALKIDRVTRTLSFEGYEYQTFHPAPDSIMKIKDTLNEHDGSVYVMWATACFTAPDGKQYQTDPLSYSGSG